MRKPKTLHAPEPWRAGSAVMEREGDGTTWFECQVFSDSLLIVKVEPCSAAGDNASEARANARRIVLCVNACRGINPQAIPKLLVAIRRLTNCIGFDPGLGASGAVVEAEKALAEVKRCLARIGREQTRGRA